MSKLFDKVKGATGSESEKAVIEATLHTAREPPPEKYVRRLVLGSANGENSLIAAALKKRLDELDWKIVLKALIVTHVLTREGDLQFTAEMLVYADKFRYLNRFADLSSGVAHTQSTFVRPYSQYIGARLRTFSEFRIDYERDPPGTKSMSVNVAVDKYPVFGAQMDTLLACKAEAATANNVLIFNALQLLVRDSMRLYQVMTMIVSRLIDEFPRQSKENMQKILDIYRTFISHTEGLNAFYDGLRSQIAECPSNLKRPPTSLKSLEDYMNNPSAHQQHDDAPPLEKLNLGSVGQPLQVHHTGVYAGAQPIYTGANPVVNQQPVGQHTQYAPANAGGAPQYPAAVVRQQSVAQMGANPFAAQPGGASPAYPAAVSSPPPQPVYNHQQLFALPTSQPQTQPQQPQAQPNPFAAPGVSYTSPVPASATQPKYPTPPSHASPPTQTSFLPPQSYASPPPAQNYSNPFAAPAAKPAPASPPQQPANLMAIASHLQNPPVASPQPTQWSPQPAAQQAPSSPFAPVAPQYGVSTAPVQPTAPTSPSAPSANMQAQFSAAAGQQPMLYYRLPTGEFVAVPASALQGMQLSAAPPPQGAPSVNPFGQQ